MGADSFGQRHFFADHRAQRAILKACDEARVDLCFFECGDGPKRECANGAPACHEVAGVDGDFTSTADHDDAAVGGKELHIVREIHARSLEEVRKKDLHAGDHVFDWPHRFPLPHRRETPRRRHGCGLQG